MSFVLRAALVIGALSYLALSRGPERHGDQRDAGVPRETETLSAALQGLPDGLRARATQAAEAEVLRRLSGARASQDTLSLIDRQPSWRGGEGR